jgi:hypothetical protein
MDITKKCPRCQHYYFLTEEEKCPFCGYDENKNNIFKDIFGDDNPFNGLGAT